MGLTTLDGELEFRSGSLFCRGLGCENWMQLGQAAAPWPREGNGGQGGKKRQTQQINQIIIQSWFRTANATKYLSYISAWLNSVTRFITIVMYIQFIVAIMPLVEEGIDSLKLDLTSSRMFASVSQVWMQTFKKKKELILKKKAYVLQMTSSIASQLLCTICRVSHCCFSEILSWQSW